MKNRRSYVTLRKAGVGLVISSGLDPADDAITLIRHLWECGLNAGPHQARTGMSIICRLRDRARFGLKYSVLFIDSESLWFRSNEIRVVQKEFPETRLVVFGNEENLKARAEGAGIGHALQMPLLSGCKETRVRELLDTLFLGG